MTYRNLLRGLEFLSEKELDQPVTIFDPMGQQFIKANEARFSTKEQESDDGFFQGVPEGTFYLTLETEE